MSASASIPYESQSRMDPKRGCGAACLSMVYRSFGKEVSQEEIWPAISKPNRFRQVSSTTHLMTKDALSRGFHAVALQARHPMQALRLCLVSGTRAILNHRVSRESGAGHYSVLVGIDAKEVILHGPVLGAARRLPPAELLDLWLPQTPDSETAGAVLIAVGPANSNPGPQCEFCHTAMPAAAVCPQCHKPTLLRPAAVLGCLRDGCIARMWNWVCCPACDHPFTVIDDNPRPTEDASPKPANTASPTTELDLSPVFNQVEKFVQHILTIPGAADHPDIKKQIEVMEQYKVKLKETHARESAARAATMAGLTAMQEEYQQRMEGHRNRKEPEKPPPLRLDGNALGHALLKKLGFQLQPISQ